MAKRRRGKKKQSVLGLFVLVIVLLLAFFGKEADPGKYTNSFLASGEVYVHYINVGQGSSALIQSGKKGILIDSGEADYSESVITYIKSCGVERLEYVIASHPHSDHIGGMTDIFDEFTVGEVIMPELSKINIPTTRLYENFLLYIDENDISVTLAEYGDKYNFEGMTFEILGPVEQVKDLNDMSVICNFDIYGSRFLFLGDAEVQELKSVCKLYPDVECDVIAMGHHGSSSSIYEPFLEKANAEVAIISCGKNNSYNHPHAEALDYIESKNMLLYRTDYDGTIVFECSDKGYERFE